MKMKKPPKPIPDKKANNIPSLNVFSPAEGDLLNNQIPINASMKPPSWVALGSPAVNVPTSTGMAAQMMADVGATLAVFPMERARYSAAIPKAPDEPARIPQKRLDGEGSPSPHSTTQKISTTAPESAASNSTWYWWLLRAACPPVKSPLPHNAAEESASITPRRLDGSMMNPLCYGCKGKNFSSVKCITGG